MAERQPYSPGFWAVDYDPEAALWKDTESELGGFDVDVRAPPDVQAVMPDIRAGIPPGPPGEAAWRMRQAVPSILQQAPQYDRDSMPPVVSALSADAVVPSLRETEQGVPMDNWRVNAEHQLQKAIRREETDPTSRLQSAGQRADPDMMSFQEWSKIDHPDVEEAKILSEVLADINRGGQPFKVWKNGEWVANPDYDPYWRNPELDGIWRLMDFAKVENFLPQGAVLPERLPGVPRASEIERLEVEGGEWKYPGFRYPSAVGQIVSDPQGQLQTTLSSTGVAVPGSESWRGGFNDKFMTSALGGLFTGDRERVLINEWEASKFPGEYEFHEDLHVVHDALARTPDLWDHIEVDGQKLINILYPKVGGNRVWDREVAHIAIYAASKVPPIVARIEYEHGGGTELYPQLFKDLSPSEKIIKADKILKAINAAATIVADEFDKVSGGKVSTVTPQGYTTTTPWMGGVMSEFPPRGSRSQAHAHDQTAYYLED